MFDFVAYNWVIGRREGGNRGGEKVARNPGSEGLRLSTVSFSDSLNFMDKTQPSLSLSFLVFQIDAAMYFLLQL